MFGLFRKRKSEPPKEDQNNSTEIVNSSIINGNYSYLFNQSLYKISNQYKLDSLRIEEWHKKNGEFVRRGDIVLTLGTDLDKNTQQFFHFAEKDGFFDSMISHHSSQKLIDGKLVYIIYENDDERIQNNYVNEPEITIDDFTGFKKIMWSSVGANYGKIFFRNFGFTFNNIETKDYIVFTFFDKDYVVRKGDIISFLFSEGSIVDFKITNNSVKLFKDCWENKFHISDEELKVFETKAFIKWRIKFINGTPDITGGTGGCDQCSGSVFNDTVVIINKFAKEYRELVRKEIPNYQPFSLEEKLSTKVSNGIDEECYVYLMIDTNNYYHKIGISNKPQWREKTLQSEKPVIELIASKKFINRKIASSFEKALHNAYSDKRIRGEWFQLDSKEVEDIKITLNN